MGFRAALPSRIAAALVVGGGALISAAQTSDANINWKAVYSRDLDAVHRTIVDHHPGVVDAENRSFAATLASALGEARGAEAHVAGYSSYRLALTRFTNRFQDAHLNVSFTRPFETIREAGIYPSYHQGELRVGEVDSRYGDAARQWSEGVLRSCDGRPIRQVFSEGVLSWYGRPSVEADWYLRAPLLFVDYGRPAPPAVATCVVEVKGKMFDVKLRWQPGSSRDVTERLNRLTTSPAGSLGVERLPADAGVWVTLPTFAVNDEASIAAMKRTIADFQQQRDWALAVVDLRGNSGGSSVWGDEFAAAAFGSAWVRSAKAWLWDGVYVDWRATEGNVRNIEELLPRIEKRHGPDSGQAKGHRQVIDNLRSAVARGDLYFSQQRRARSGTPKPRPSPLPGRLVVITDPRCFSACLDFMDLLRLHPGVIHVGLTTGVDTNYMENWSGRLPSGFASVNYPMKVYRNRRRGTNVAYAPHVTSAARLADTAAVRQWILDNYRRW